MFTVTFCDEDETGLLSEHAEGDDAYEFLTHAIQQYPNEFEFIENKPYQLTIDKQKITVCFSHTITKINETELRQYDASSKKRTFNKYIDIVKATRLTYTNNRIFNTGENRELEIIQTLLNNKAAAKRLSALYENEEKLSWRTSAGSVSFPAPKNQTKTVTDRKVYEGINLKNYINNLKNVDFEERVKIAIAFIRALEQLHGKNLVHRNLSSRFIRYHSKTNTAHIELSEYTARIGEQNSFYEKNARPDIWEGNYKYAGQEVITNEILSPEMDIGSAVIIVAELLGFENLFQHRDKKTGKHKPINEILKTHHHMRISDCSCPELLKPTLNQFILNKLSPVSPRAKGHTRSRTSYSSPEKPLLLSRPSLTKFLNFLENDLKNELPHVRKIESIQNTCAPYQDYYNKEILKGVKTLPVSEGKKYFTTEGLNIQKIYEDFSSNTRTALSNLEKTYRLAIEKHKALDDLQQKLIDKTVKLSDRIKNFEIAYKQNNLLHQHRDKISQWFSEKINAILEKINIKVSFLPTMGHKLTKTLDTLFFAPELVKG